MKMKGQISALILSTCSMIVAFSVWSIFSPIAGVIQELYGLSSTQKSILIAIPVLLGSMMRIPMGMMADWLGGKRVYTSTLLFLLIPLIGASFAASYQGLLFYAFWIGMAGTTFAISIAYVSKWYSPEKQGLVLGIAGIGNLGSAVASFTVPQLAAQWGIPWTFRIYAMVLALMFVAFWTGTRELPRSRERIKLKDSLVVVKFKETWILSCYYFLTFGGFVSFSMYLPVLVQEIHHLNAVHAGYLTGVFVITATVVRPVGGYLSDRYGAVKILTIVFSNVLLGIVLLTSWIDNMMLFSIACLLMAAMYGIGNGAVFKRVAEVSRGHIGAVTGVVGAAGGLGGFFPPIVLGIIKDSLGDYTLGFLLLGLFAIGCLVHNNIGYLPTCIRKTTYQNKG